MPLLGPELSGKIASLAVLAITLAAIGALLRRLLEAFRTRRGLPWDVVEVTTRVYDTMAVIIFTLAIAIAFFPQYWGLLLLMVAVAGIVAILLASPLRFYLSFVSIRLGPRFRGKYCEFLLPGHDRTVHGRVTSVDAYYVTLQDALGREMLVPNKLLNDAVVRPSVPTLTYRLRVSLEWVEGQPTEESVSRAIETVVSTVEALEHPVVKKEKKVLVNDVGKEHLELLVMVHPLSVPVRWSDLNSLALSFYSALTGIGAQGLGFRVRSVRVELTGAT